jgi:hypothetical protein
MGATQLRKENNRRLIEAVKMQGCVDCGSMVHRNLTFDHLDSSQKKFNIASGVGQTLAALVRELRKCEVVCTSCHVTRERIRLHQTGKVKAPILELYFELKYIEGQKNVC